MMATFNNLLDDYCRLKTPSAHQPMLAKSGKGKHADLYLYGVVGSYDVNLTRFKRELDAAGAVDTITVYLNTIGGSFADGLPIYNTLKQHPAQVTIKIMGYALSIGSVIMLAGDHIECAENGLVMIHRAQALTYGDVDEHNKAMLALDRHEAAILPGYARRMGITTPAVLELMKAETWYTAQDALNAGLIDSITGATDLATAEQQAGVSEDGGEILQHYQHKPQNFQRRDVQRAYEHYR